MEVAGLAFSVAGLAALFTTCVDGFNLITTGSNYGIDYDILIVKLGVEQFRLLSWGEAVGILEGPEKRDARLEREYLRQTVFSLLSCFKRIFEDTEALRKRYGLKESKDTEESVGILEETFRSTYERFNKKAEERQKKAKFGTKARWAISDKKQLMTLVEELKGFNDSLNAILPGIDVITKEKIKRDIMESKSIRQLKVLQAASVKEGGDGIWEAASIRLDALSTMGPEEEDEEDEKEQVKELQMAGKKEPEEEPKVPNDVEKATRLMDRLHFDLEKKNDGALVFSSSYSDGPNYQTMFSVWPMGQEPVEGDWDRGVGDEYVAASHPAFELYRAKDLEIDGWSRLYQLDVEIDPKYTGLIPGTVTVSGFSTEITAWQVESNPKLAETISISRNPIPPIALKDMLDRGSKLQANGLGPGWTERQGYEGLRMFLGPDRTTWMNPSTKYMLLHQIVDLCSNLNNTSVFPSFAHASTIGQHCFHRALIGHPNTTIADFFVHMLLATELRLRLERSRGTSYGGTTQKVALDMLVSKLWYESVTIEHNEKDLTLWSRVHERQTEGLLRFAARLKWPYMSSLREFAETAYRRLRAGEELHIFLWDWFYGLSLPGAYFSTKIMISMILATPEVMDKPPEGTLGIECGVLLEGYSYWRTRSNLGRVLCGNDTTPEVAGWMGPSLPVVGMKAPKIVRLKSRIVGHARPPQDPASRDWQKKVQSLMIKARWTVPAPPKPSTDSTNIEGIQLTALPKVGDNEVEYEPALQVRINGKAVETWKLYSNPSFITSHACIGNHITHPGEKWAFKHVVVEIRELAKHEIDSAKITVINVNGCKGSGETVARAWCAMKGSHAVVCRARRTCFRCAVFMAGPGGLNVGVLIWNSK